MRVLVITPSLADVGGIQRYSVTLIRALQDLLGNNQVRCLELAAPKHKITGRLSAVSKLWFLCVAVCGATFRPNLIVCTHLSLGPVGWLLSTTIRRPFWIVAHGIEAWVSLPYWKRAALKSADRVIVTGAFGRQQLITRQGIPSERLLTLPCTVDENLLIPHSKHDRDNWFGDRSLILTVARMSAREQYKGHDVVLRALPLVLRNVPDTLYVVVGDGDDRQRLQALTMEIGVSENVHFTGPIDDSELADLYRRSDVFALPARTVIDERDSKGEGFGIVFLEAMAFGKPVIGPNCGAPAEFIQHGKNGLVVDAESPESVAEALVQVLQDKENAAEMGEAGRALVEQQFSYRAFRDQLKQALASNGNVVVTTTPLTCES